MRIVKGIFVLVCSGACWLECIAGAQDFTGSSAARENVLRFPTDRSLGVLFAVPESEAKAANFDWRGSRVKRIGYARGEITIPARHWVRLDVSQDACENLSALADLPPNAIQALYFAINSNVAGQFQHIGYLTDLRYLHFPGCRMSSDGFEHLARLTNLEELICSAYGYKNSGFTLNDDDLQTIAGLPRLQKLGLQENPITDRGLVTLANCKSLESLELIGTEVTGVGVDSLLMLPNLTRLRFGAYHRGAPVDDEGMQAIGMMSQLLSLDLSGTKITDAGLSHVRGLKDLQELTLDYTDVTDDGLRNLHELTQLRTLRFYKREGQLGDLAAEHLSELPSLENITGDWNVSGLGFQYLAEIPKLKSIDFYRCVNDETVAFIARMTNLEQLGFENCDISDSGLARLSPLKKLTHFSIHTSIVTSDSLETLSQLPELKYLRLDVGNGRRPIPPGRAWKKLADMKQLERLYLSGLILQDQHAGVFTSLENLTTLDIENHDPLPASFIDAVSQLPKLKALRIHEVEMESTLLQQLAKSIELEQLVMAVPLTDQQLMILAELPALRQLKFKMDRVTSGGVEAFKKGSNSILRIDGW